MINKVIDIDVDYTAMGVQPSPRQTTLTTYILDERNIMDSGGIKRPAVIVCPGGAYGGTSPIEAEPIALKYCAAGFHAFVLDYSVAPSAWPAATCELSRAISYVRKIADENNIDGNKIFVAGFSAGGHLAASIGVHWNHPDVIKYSGIEDGSNKPNGLILGYPVITGEEGRTHRMTIDNFVGGRESVKPLAWLENYVTEETPQTFIWHTFTDDCVPVISTLRFAGALEAHNVKFEMHIYPNGRHGLSTGDNITCPPGTGMPCVTSWIDMCIRWINEFEN